MPLTQVDQGLLGQYAQYTGFKNRIINGAMMIDQRNAGASVSTASSNTTYTLDRFQVYYAQTSKFTIQQNAGSITPPVGFSNYLGITSSSAYSSLSGDYFFLRQSIEGLNVADLSWGAASAQPVTLSFWVRSSLTGTFSGVLRNGAENLTYAFTYSISSANTWTAVSVTVAGPTSGTWLTTNGIGIEVMWNLGSGSAGLTGTTGSWVSGGYFGATGSVSVVGTNGATFYITGVQLEEGSTATSFDYRPYGTELALCQRYLPVYTASAANELICYAQAASTTVFRAIIPFQVTTRVKSTGITVSSTSDFYVNGNVNATPSAMVWNDGTLNSGAVQITGSGMTAGFSCVLYSNTSTAKIIFTGCEL